MSIHAQLSEEAQAKFNAQKRNATISSIFLSILAIVALFLLLGIFLLPNLAKESPTLVAYSATTSLEDVQEEKKVSKQIQKKPSPPSNQQTKVLSVSNTSAVSIPVPDVEVSAPSADFGAGEDFGGGWGGDSFGEGGGDFGGVPASMQSRCTESDRLTRLAEAGGSLDAEKAVKKALKYLQGTQLENGSWIEETNRDHYPYAMTGYALLTYLGHCETPDSAEYGDTVSKAITFLVDAVMETKKIVTSVGSSAASSYEHAITTYALAEAYTLCNSMGIKVPSLKKAVKKAGDIIMAGQNKHGGWNYGYSQGKPGGDFSLGSWQAQALKACKLTEIWPKGEIQEYADLAAILIKSTQNQDGSVGYKVSKPTKNRSLTSGSLLTLQMFGHGDSPEAKKAKDWIKENEVFSWDGKGRNLYYHYYNALSMRQAGGKHWKWYNKLFSKKLIAAQEDDGSWSHPAKFSHSPTGRHMTTCLATMMLEVYYRFLPGAGDD